MRNPDAAISFQLKIAERESRRQKPMALRKKFMLTLAGLLMSVSATAQERTLSGDEIRETFSGTVAYGHHFKNNVRMKIEIRNNGKIYMIYSYDLPRPYRIRGKWDIEDDSWCRKMSPPATNTDRKCQKIIEDNGAYYFVDEDGYRSSRIFKKDIKKR
jgi:hypothetical protein